MVGGLVTGGALFAVSDHSADSFGFYAVNVGVMVPVAWLTILIAAGAEYRRASEGTGDYQAAWHDYRIRRVVALFGLTTTFGVVPLLVALRSFDAWYVAIPLTCLCCFFAGAFHLAKFRCPRCTSHFVDRGKPIRLFSGTCARCGIRVGEIADANDGPAFTFE
jgi:hypothetical protein